METVGAIRRFFACVHEGGASGHTSVNQGQKLICGRGCPRRIRFGYLRLAGRCRHTLQSSTLRMSIIESA
jgi:hypothetical protein